MTFPLRALPFLALKLVIEQVDFFDLVIHALINRCFKRIMNSCRYRIDLFKMEQDRFIIKSHDVRIEIWMMINRPDYSSTVNIKGRPAFVDIEKTGQKERFDRNAINIHFLNEKNDFYDLEQVCEYLMEFLIPQNVDIHFEDSIKALSNFFAWDKFNKYTEIELMSSFSKPIELPSQRLKFILENLTIDELILNIVVKNTQNYKYRYRGPARRDVKINHLYIANSKWVNHVRLFDDFNATTISCMIPTSKMINLVLKKWIKGTHESIEEVRMHIGFLVCRQHCKDPLVREDILNGIRSTSSTHQMSKLNYIKLMYTYHTPLGIDIERNCDGRKATLWIGDFEMAMKIWPAQ
ncbi:unnamed protein product [Caenorhabditis brenneri]